MKEKGVISRNKYTDEDLFVLYSLPDDANHYLVSQDEVENDNNQDLDNFEGFIIEAFDRKGDFKPVFIRGDNFIQNPYIEFRCQQNFDRICIGKEDYMELVEYFRLQCEKGIFDKVVLSRIKKIEREGSGSSRRAENLMLLFLSLKQKYPSAFIYLLNIPGLSCWIGASPEILLTKKNGIYSTVALAGTMKSQNKNLESVIWGEKEVREQTLVERYFEDAIKEFDENFEKNGPFTRHAGNVLHICTSFQFESKSPVSKILDSLHPSPAICGLPKTEAFGFINEMEPHERRYYTGFLGPVSKQGNTEFYVNLRCMEVSGNSFFLYVGGGITKDSNPESEWEETESKSTTLQSIIEKMYLYSDVIR